MAPFVSGFYYILNGIVQLFIVLGGVVPYIPQAIKIRDIKNSEGFSSYVCLLLLIANILRIEFWFAQPFPTALLVQAIVMIFAMLIMTYLCVRYQPPHLTDSGKPQNHRFTDLDLAYFWKWSNFASYAQFVILFIVLTALPCFALHSRPLFAQSLGYAALLMESMLAVPQLVQNLQKKSTHGMSPKMVFLWAIGDTFKTAYFVISMAPIQFLVCGIIQITVDALIFAQFCYDGLRKSHETVRSRI